MAKSRRSIQVGPREKQWLYGLLSLLWVTGAVWFYYGTRMLPIQSLILKIHGAAAMGFTLVLGMFLQDHVPAGWKQNDHRPSGASLIAACGILMMTGWGLYYIGNDLFRLGTHWVHSIVGLLLPVIIFLHVRQARQRAKKQDTTPRL